MQVIPCIACGVLNLQGQGGFLASLVVIVEQLGRLNFQCNGSAEKVKGSASGGCRVRPCGSWSWAKGYFTIHQVSATNITYCVSYGLAFADAGLGVRGECQHERFYSSTVEWVTVEGVMNLAGQCYTGVVATCVPLLLGEVLSLQRNFLASGFC